MAVEQGLRVRGKSFEPFHLVIELGAGARVAVGQVEASNDYAVDRRFQIPALCRVGIARESTAGLDRPADTAKDRNTVPALLTVPDRFIAKCGDGSSGKTLVGRLQLLQANDMRTLLVEPAHEHGQTTVDAVNVIGCDLHPDSSSSISFSSGFAN